jgi:hypothetical protein
MIMGDSTRLVMPVEGSHFYTRDGQPLYDVELKTRPGEWRRATVADARKADAYPSTTTVGGILDKPALVAWKINNVLLAAATMPRIENESADDWAKRVQADADGMSSGAADLGTLVHRMIEDYFAGRSTPAEGYEKYLNPIDAWVKAEGIIFTGLEKVCVNTELKYGCKVDAVGTDRAGTPVIIDWKTQKSSKGKLTAWDDHQTQIAANAVAAGIDLSGMARLFDVYVSTTETDQHGNALCMIKEWTMEERKDGFRMFQLCREIYGMKNRI